MTLKVLSAPHWDNIVGHGESGIKRVIEKYFRHLPDYDIELVGPHASSFDLLAIHAGMSNRYDVGGPIVAHVHGLYWQGDYQTYGWQAKANRDVTASIRHASMVTVPTNWVAMCMRRDMHIDPVILPHGVDWEEWQEPAENEGYVLWNKNRDSDACDPRPVTELAQRFPEVRFSTTFAPDNSPPNIKAIGTVTHSLMKGWIKGAAVYLATTKETFGIGTLEAMAAGIPILGFDYGGTAQLCRHGVNGYLARVGDYHDLAEGLSYVLAHRGTLAENSRVLARNYPWQSAARVVAETYARAMAEYHQSREVAVVIPCYNKGTTLGRAVHSVLGQSRVPVKIVIVNNNSTDDSWSIAKQLDAENPHVITVINENRQGVAHARNAGIALANTRYICCLDADDEIEPGFLEVCVAALEADASLGLAYTRLRAISPDGTSTVSMWPGEYNFDRFIQGQNQVPTCCVFRHDLWRRLGGYRQRYAPHGAGAEDADFWFRMGASGHRGKLASTDPLFRYHLGGAVSGNPNYREVNWRKWHPFVQDGIHPFASVATPSNELSHPVRAYDTPRIAVVVPVADYHRDVLVDALDSIEGQTMREWELIVVADGFEFDKSLREAYPYVTYVELPKCGAGAARNAGAKLAKAPYLLFLDADDWLTPDALSIMYNATMTHPGHIIYGDYLGHAVLEPRERERLRASGRLQSYDDKTNQSVIQYQSLEYDCELAAKQPQVNERDGSFYIWNLVTSLVPKLWHDEIGGFDEQMPSWEDWDYWLRLAWRGKCFVRVPRTLVEYRFYTGQRRAIANPSESGESGRQLSGKLLQYLQGKRRGETIMPCGGCKKQTPVHAIPAPSQVMQPFQDTRMASMANVSPDDMVSVELIDGNYGDHPISFGGTFYGYRSHGDKFKMLRAHAVNLRVVRIIDNSEMLPVFDAPVAPRTVPAAPPSLAPVTEEPKEAKTITLTPQVFDFTKIWGINEERAEKLRNIGIRTLSGLLSFDADRLGELLELPPGPMARVLKSAKSLAD